jgi:hypothetical protein
MGDMIPISYFSPSGPPPYGWENNKEMGIMSPIKRSGA